jgi:hypothetical protein
MSFGKPFDSPRISQGFDAFKTWESSPAGQIWSQKMSPLHSFMQHQWGQSPLNAIQTALQKGLPQVGQVMPTGTVVFGDPTVGGPDKNQQRDGT